jgi:dihydrofolate reductase
MTRLTLIAAVAEGGVIGRDGAIPWRVPGELARFKETTMGHPLVMGRKTFESIGRPLPGRRCIVITRSLAWRHPGVETAHSFAQALALAGPADEVFVAGGGQVYAEALPFAHRMILSEIPQDHEGDAHFPAWSPSQWREVSRTPYPGYAVVTYERR